jgi:hypothetical protein
VIATKLLALDEHALDYSSLLSISRALRERIDWDAVRKRTQESPYARAFFTLLRELDVIPQPRAGERPQIRVVTE